MMRIAGMLSIGFALVLLAIPAHAGEVKVGGVAVQLSPPSGYCDMDKSFNYDKADIASYQLNLTLVENDPCPSSLH